MFTEWSKEMEGNRKVVIRMEGCKTYEYRRGSGRREGEGGGEEGRRKVSEGRQTNTKTVQKDARYMTWRKGL